MPAESEKTSLFFGPREFGAPDALLIPILSTIQSAQEQLLIATQQLDHRDVIGALATARRSGVRVQVLIERDYVRESRPLDDIWASGGSHEPTREALAALYRANIDVRVERRARLMHHNFIVADSATDTAVTVSTSANLTLRGLHRNLNHLLVVHDRKVASAFANEFQGLWNEQLDSPHPARAPRSVGDTMTVMTVFGPEHDPEKELTNRIKRAKRTIHFSVSSFSEGSKIDDALIQSRRAGVQVYGLLDGMQAGQRWAATDALERAGLLVYVTEDLFPPQLHHKLMVLDDATMCIGTFNYSVAGARKNEEAVIVLTPRSSGASEDLAKYAKREILRIQQKFSVSASRLLGG